MFIQFQFTVVFILVFQTIIILAVKNVPTSDNLLLLSQLLISNSVYNLLICTMKIKVT